MEFFNVRNRCKTKTSKKNHIFFKTTSWPFNNTPRPKLQISFRSNFVIQKRKASTCKISLGGIFFIFRKSLINLFKIISKNNALSINHKPIFIIDNKRKILHYLGIIKNISSLNTIATSFCWNKFSVFVAYWHGKTIKFHRKTDFFISRKLNKVFTTLSFVKRKHQMPMFNLL